MSNPTALVQKLWNYCNMGLLAAARSGLRPSTPQNPFRSLPSGSSLRDDGLSYGDYVEQLTFLLFLKMADEQARPPFNKPSPVPKGADRRLSGQCSQATRKLRVTPYLSYLICYFQNEPTPQHE